MRYCNEIWSGLTSLCKKCDDIITCAGSGHHLRSDRIEPGAPYFGKSLPVRPLSLPEFLRWCLLSSRLWFVVCFGKPKDDKLSIGCFQQDGAASHTSHASVAEIQSFFSDRVIPKGLWPPRSPDLTLPYYFLWGYLKGRIYQNKPRTRDALKANITEEIQAVTADVLARTFQNMACRVQSCLDANGGHFQHKIWCRHFSYTMR